MKKLTFALLFLFLSTAHSSDQRTDCINAIVRGAQANAPSGRTYAYLSEHKALVENIGSQQWLYVDHGAAFNDTPGEYYSCVAEDRDPERDLNRKVLSLLNETYENSPNPQAFINTVRVPCRNSGMRAILGRVSELGNVGYSGAGAGANGAIDGDPD